MKMPMSPRPCPPVPIQPIAMRLLGATAPSLPSADDGTMCGNATAAVAVAPARLRNCLRVAFLTRILLVRSEILPVTHPGCCRSGFELEDDVHLDARPQRQAGHADGGADTNAGVFAEHVAEQFGRAVDHEVLVVERRVAVDV